MPSNAWRLERALTLATTEPFSLGGGCVQRSTTGEVQEKYNSQNSCWPRKWHVSWVRPAEPYRSVSPVSMGEGCGKGLLFKLVIYTSSLFIPHP